MTKLKQYNWFYFAALIFAVSFPFFEALISISAVLLLISSIITFNKSDLSAKWDKKKYLLFFSGIYFTYAVWLINTHDWNWALFDIRKNIPYLIIPIAFLLSTKLSDFQFKRILYVFSISVLVAAIYSVFQFYFFNYYSILQVQIAGFINHIHFSLEIIFAIIIIAVGVLTQYAFIGRLKKVASIIVLLFLITFLGFNQSLTGILTLIGTAILAAIIWGRRISSGKLKLLTYAFLFSIIAISLAYVGYVVNTYYNVDEISQDTIAKYTAQGNPYMHNFEDKRLENGHYLGLYLCEEELQNEWNKRSEQKYHDLGQNNYETKYTLIRYLTSKNLTKDSVGVASLSNQDISNIQNGISNYILAGNRFSLYPKVYVCIWELDTYFKTGNANDLSLSQRIEYTKAAFYIIRNNFWFGVGTGNWKEEYAKTYQLLNSSLKPDRYQIVHNQYLNYMVKFGLVGLLIILFSILYPVIKTKAYRNPVFLLFLIVMLIGVMADSFFETHVGAYFFSFFYCLLLTRSMSESIE